MAIAANFPSIKPSLNLDFANVGRLDPRVTFARASTATYYDGVTTAVAEQNLLLQSQDFTTSWANANSTDTADTETAPDGTATADTITDDATSGIHQIWQAPSFSINTTYAYSCFLKAGTSGYAALQVWDPATSQRYFVADFDLSGGTVRTSGAGTSATLTSSSITSVGNGWYRCSIIGQLAAAGTVRVSIAVSDGTTSPNTFGSIAYVGTGSTIIAWGAQLEQRSAVTAYTATTTQPITNYIPVLLTAQNGVPRFDHTPTTGAALGLEIEEQRTNLVTYSEDFANAAWTLLAANLTSNTIVAPDGTLTGDKMFEDTANAAHGIRPTTDITVVANGTYTLSVFVKAAERSKFRAYFIDTAGSNGVSANFDLSAGTTSGATNAGSGSGATSSIVNVGNGWYRCVVSGSMGGGITTCRVRLRILNAAGTEVYTGDGYSGLFIWGAQLEAGAFPTSYIATTTTALTRSADAASMTGTNFSSFYNQAEGSIVTQFVATTTGVNSTGGNAFPFLYDIDSAAEPTSGHTLAVSAGYGPGWNASTSILGVTQASFTSAMPLGNNSVRKIAYAYQTNNFAACANGGTVSTDTSGNLPSLNRLAIGSQNLGNTPIFTGYIQRIAYYPGRLSNAQLQALTG